MADDQPAVETTNASRWTGAEMFWLAVLVVSILVGFGLTLFAPT
jgi:hypothetical protein